MNVFDTLMPSIPSINMKSINHKIDYIKASESLISIIRLFMQKYNNVTFLIDDIDYHSWFKNYSDSFTHRVKVKVIKL
jgi:hypothetical protein